VKAQPETGNLKRYGLSALSGALLALSFPRFDWAPLAWFALVPLFFAIHSLPPRRAALNGGVAGLVFYLIGLSWVTRTLIDYGHIAPAVSWLILMLLVAYLSCFIALFCYLTRRLCQDSPVFFFLLAPVLWTGLEYLRSSHGTFGFSWLGLGYSQYASLPFVQIADITGVFGVTALIVLVNAGLFVVSHPAMQRRPGFGRLRWGVAAATIGFMAASWGYGFLVLNTAKVESPALKIGLVQGNIPQQMKWDPQYRDEVMQRYLNLSIKARAAGPLDLMVWPEAVTPFYFELDAPGTEQVRGLVQATGVPLLFGSPAMADDPGLLPFSGRGRRVLYNSAYFLDAAGQTQGRYDKIHLVPFGEFVPFRRVLFFVEKLVVGIGDFGRGDSYDVFEVNGQPFGVSICYEITFPDLVRQPVKDGARFLVNITNDAWFGKSAASYQHIAMAALRAVENRVPVVRAANTGITGLIDPTGRIRQATELFVEDVVTGQITPRAGAPTFYSSHGDIFAWLCLSFSVIFGFVAWMRSL